MKLSIAVACLLAFAPTSLVAASQQITAGEALAMRERAAGRTFSARAEWQALGFYMQGVVEGAAGYQNALRERGKQPLFCPPAGKSFSLDELFAIMEAAKPANRIQPAVGVILDAYAEKYPCKD